MSITIVTATMHRLLTSDLQMLMFADADAQGTTTSIAMMALGFTSHKVALVLTGLMPIAVKVDQDKV
jgi:hypothetical protein